VPDDARRHVRRVMGAGCIDSFGLAFGWTVFNLEAVYRYGLAATAVFNAAMFVGVALSAPASGWLTSRYTGRGVLQTTAVVDGALRIASLVLLVAGAPVALVAVVVGVTNVAAWTGYAGMRAEISAAAGHVTAMTRYATVVIGTEAVGAMAAAFIPIRAGGAIAGWLLGVAAVVYGVVLVPTYVIAFESRVGRRMPSAERAHVARRRRGPLALGAAVMLLCAGPTLLFVGLSARLHGRVSVAGAAASFAVGSLAAPAMARAVHKLRLPSTVEWPAWGIGMVLGWALAPWSVVGLLVAQFCSGVCLTGFQGVMDFELAGGSSDGDATVALAQGSAARAVGSAAAVRLVPFFAAPMAMTQLALVSPLCVALGAVFLWGFEAAPAPRTDRRRLRPKPKLPPSGDPTPRLEPGALERSYSRPAADGSPIEEGEHESAGRPAL
jgi:hypothetical protein